MAVVWARRLLSGAGWCLDAFQAGLGEVELEEFIKDVVAHANKWLAA